MKQCVKPQVRQKDLSLDELKSLFIKKQKEAKMENHCIHEMERDNKDMYIDMINWFEQVIKSRSKTLMNKEILTEEMIVIGGKDKGVLKRFMVEFFHYPTLKKAGFFTKEMKGDYYAQAKQICHHFGYKSIFEYRAKEIRCHLSYAGKRPDHNKEFITVTPSIYE